MTLRTTISQADYTHEPKCPSCEFTEITETGGEVMDDSYQREMTCEREGCDATWTESYTMDVYTMNQMGSATRTVEITVTGTVTWEIEVALDEDEALQPVRQRLDDVFSTYEMRVD